MLCLYIKAPFAVFRPFTAGSFRPTADFITFSAAYGLLMNIAGIETRFYDDTKPMTLIKPEGLPYLKIAIGAPSKQDNPLKISVPLKHSIYQQLHNYPVGASGKEKAEYAKGTKYNIQPIRRSFLSDLKAYVMFEGTGEFENQFLEGIKSGSKTRYGIPFLGDNNFIIDKLQLIDQPGPIFWYQKLTEDSDGILDNATRLTITIDRFDMSRTKTALFSPIGEPVENPPEKAWVEVTY